MQYHRLLKELSQEIKPQKRVNQTNKCRNNTSETPYVEHSNLSPGSRPMTEPQGSIISVSPKLSLFSLCFPACAAAMTCNEDYQSCYLNL